MIELRHLRYFVAVAEELNFSRAAERLHMAQPPLSVAIQQLEGALGVQLLNRSTRAVALTDAGQAFLDGARRTLAELQHSMTAAQRTAAGELGTLRLAFGWAARFDTLPAIGRAFRSRHPDVALLTEEMWNARMPDALRSGEADIALALCPDVAADLSVEPVRRERVFALIAPGPADPPAAVRLADLADDEFVLFARELAPRLYDALVGLCRNAGFEPAVRRDTIHTDWSLGVLGDVPVVSLAPESVARQPPDGVAAVAIEDAAVLETSLVWATDRLSPAAAALRAVAAATYTQAV